MLQPTVLLLMLCKIRGYTNEFFRILRTPCLIVGVPHYSNLISFLCLSIHNTISSSVLLFI